MDDSDQNDDAEIDFFEAQQNVGSDYFMYIIQDGVVSGGGTSCYFWYSSPSQMLNCIKNYIDFWSWRDGPEESSRVLAAIIDGAPNAVSLSDDLRQDLDKYMKQNAGIHLWSWGRFSDLCTSSDIFCEDVRREFRVDIVERGADGVDAEEADG